MRTAEQDRQGFACLDRGMGAGASMLRPEMTSCWEFEGIRDTDRLVG